MCDAEASDANYWYKIGVCDGYISGVLATYERQRTARGLKDCVEGEISRIIILAFLPDVNQNLPAEVAILRALQMAIPACD